MNHQLKKTVKKWKSKTTKAVKLRNLETRELVYDLDDKKCTKCDSDLVEVWTKTS